jgi:hypothetical protein
LKTICMSTGNCADLKQNWRKLCSAVSNIFPEKIFEQYLNIWTNQVGIYILHDKNIIFLSTFYFHELLVIKIIQKNIIEILPSFVNSSGDLSSPCLSAK